MKRTLAVGGIAILAVVSLAGCATRGTSTPNAMDSELQKAATSTAAAPSPSMTLNSDSEVVPAPNPTPSAYAPAREAITLEDDDDVVEMKVNEVLPITGLPDDDLHHAAFVTSTSGEVVTLQQRVLGPTEGQQSNPTVYATAPGVATLTVYDTDPGGNGQKVVMTFTVHVKDATGAAMLQGLTGVPADIAAGGMREGEAINAAQDAGYAVRIESEDGKAMPKVTDSNPNRLNLVVNDGIVTSLTVG